MAEWKNNKARTKGRTGEWQGIIRRDEVCGPARIVYELNFSEIVFVSCYLDGEHLHTASCEICLSNSLYDAMKGMLGDCLDGSVDKTQLKESLVSAFPEATADVGFPAMYQQASLSYGVPACEKPLQKR